MGLFDFFKKTPEVSDPLFGGLDRKPNAAGGYVFTCNYFFKPVGSQIYCSIKADQSGPTDAQRLFFKKIEENYSALKEKIAPLLANAFKEAFENFEITNFDKEFTLSSISMPKIETGTVVWEICYITVHDENHDFTIHLNDFEPEEDVEING